MSRSRRLLGLAAAAVMTVVGLPTAAGADAAPWQQVLDITFPTLPQAQLTDTFDACRSGCSRFHQAADLIGEQMWPLYAVTDGEVCGIDEGEEDSWGRHITICGDDGNRYRYLHLNNDTPGTDDGQAELSDVYAPGIRRGTRVARGQLIAYMGDSGNAEATARHLHFDIYVPGVTNPYGEERINPYPSLRAALDRGDIPDGTAIATERMTRWAGDTRIETAVAVSEATYASAETVVIATADAPQDALVAGPLAAELDAPVLITGDRLDPAVAAEIDRLGAQSAILVGDVLSATGAVSDALAGDATVTRISGPTPFATAALVAERVWELTGATGTAISELEAGPLPGDGPTEPTLLVADGPDRAAPAGTLDGAVVPADAGQLYVWLAGTDPGQVARVEFRVDDAGGGPDHVEWRWPYDLAGTGDDGPNPWTIDRLAPGDHAVTATVVGHDGTRDDVTATFRIDGGGARRAIVALGQAADASRAWPDALSASWYGAVRHLPVLLTRPASLPAPTAEALSTVDAVWLSGGRAAIGDAQADEIAALVGAEPVRLWGEDRFGTAAALAQDLLDRGLVSAERIVVATGHNWPDAVTAGAAVAERGETLLLVHGVTRGTKATESAVRVLAERTTEVVGLGGTAAIAGDVLREVAAWAL